MLYYFAILVKGIIYGEKASLYEECFGVVKEWETDWNDP